MKRGLGLHNHELLDVYMVNGVVPHPCVTIFPTAGDVEIAAANAVAIVIKAALTERGRCLVAFSGGRTPGGVYRRLGDLLVSQAVDLSRIQLIFVDERMAPPDDSGSNYGMIQREFIASAALPPANVHRIRGELKADAAALDYERELAIVLPLFAGRCDLMLLGVGEDGHIASLFPAAEALFERRHAAQPVFVPHLGSWRVTLTLPVINQAREIIMLVTGRHKSAIVGSILASSQARADLPATLVRPDSGTLTWMLDAAAASLIPSGYF